MVEFSNTSEFFLKFQITGRAMSGGGRNLVMAGSSRFFVSEDSIPCFNAPTPVPTAPPTFAPTSPTSSPTSSPTAGSVSGTGDPHLVNVLGQRFDLYQPGVHSLIQIPKSLREKTALLVKARASHVGGSCTDLYFTEINITGTWTRGRRAADLTWAAEDVVPGRPRWNSFRQVSVKVVHGRTLLGTRYLNVLVRGLDKANLGIGGLLGEDDHTAASTPSIGCKRYQIL
jgi:hypothetical protein